MERFFEGSIKNSEDMNKYWKFTWFFGILFYAIIMDPQVLLSLLECPVCYKVKIYNLFKGNFFGLFEFSK